MTYYEMWTVLAWRVTGGVFVNDAAVGIHRVQML